MKFVLELFILLYWGEHSTQINSLLHRFFKNVAQK